MTSGPDQDLEKIELMILQAVGAARSSVKIMTPYFLPDDRIITALALASMRGVQVDVVLPASSNHPTLDWGARAHIGPLLAAQCRVWTHGAPFDHSKLMTIDGEWCLIGSANWDMRSFRLNFELNVEIYHSPLVAQLQEFIAQKQQVRLSPELLEKNAAANRATQQRRAAHAPLFVAGDLPQAHALVGVRCHLNCERLRRICMHDTPELAQADARGHRQRQLVDHFPGAPRNDRGAEDLVAAVLQMHLEETRNHRRRSRPGPRRASVS